MCSLASTLPDHHFSQFHIHHLLLLSFQDHVFPVTRDILLQYYSITVFKHIKLKINVNCSIAYIYISKFLPGFVSYLFGHSSNVVGILFNLNPSKIFQEKPKMCKLTSLISMLFAPESMEFSINSLTTDDTEVMTWLLPMSLIVDCGSWARGIFATSRWTCEKRINLLLTTINIPLH